VHAFLWTPNDGLRDLGTLGGTFAEAFGVNARGDVVGRSTLPGETDIHAFLWTEHEGMRDLDTLGGFFSQPLAISNSGEITGFSTVTGDAAFHAVVWLPGGGKGQTAGPQIRDLVPWAAPSARRSP
jgi:probable HAF family extracellular repeat protein